MASKRQTVGDLQRQKAIVDRTGDVAIGRSKLTLEKVRWVKEELMKGEAGRRELANALGVGTETIARIDRGDSWAHVPWPEKVEQGVRLVVPEFKEELVAPATAAESLALVLEKLGPGYKPVDTEDPNEMAKRKLLRSLGIADEDLGTSGAPVNLDELP